MSFSLSDTLTGQAARQATQVAVSRTAAELRVLFRCEDSLPWATITRRDGPLYQEEVVEVFIDPFGDLECYFEIEVNPLNTVLDLALRRIGRGWRKETGWHCAGLATSTSRTARGWDAELSIPLEAIAPSLPHPGDCWRANFFRIDRPAGDCRELSAWSPTGRATFHEPSRFGFLEF